MIYFVGAGPGAADLITVRGKSLLEKADAVIYAGSLVNPDLLCWTKKGCKIYNSASMTLEETVSTMEKEEGKGKTVVRLHTGDQSIFGAVREQMDLLQSKGLEYESVPGVSSFCGAAASLGVEYTLPNVSQTVILTRMEGRTPVPESEEISKLASHKASMAIFLSSGMLAELSEKLISGGYKPETPAAIVYKATWPDEIKIITTVANIAYEGDKHGINKTALVLVGDFLGTQYGRSKLYDPSFTHGFRNGIK